MRPDAHRFHGGRRVRRRDHIEPGADRTAAVGLFADPRHRKILAGPLGRVRRAAENALLVFVHVHDDRLVALAANDFLAALKIEPAVAAAILPAGRAAGPAIFDEKIARVGVHVRDAPRQPVACGRPP